MLDVNAVLQTGLAAAQAGNKAEAHACFVAVIEQDRRNELAWLWLSSVLPTAEQALKCLDHLLTINPDNVQAREAKEILQVRMLLEEASIFKHSKTDAPPASSALGTMRLGELLVDRGILTREELGKALAEQVRLSGKGKRLRLGEVLVNLKLIRREQLAMALHKQMEAMRRQSQGSPVTSLGQCLVERTYITPEQLAYALSIQSAGKQRGSVPKLGDVLIKLGYVTDIQLERVLKEQAEEYNSHFH